MELKPHFKDIAKDLFYHFGISGFLFHVLRRRNCPKLLVFRYHRVSPSLDNNTYLSIPQECFEEQIRFIKSNFKTVNMSEGASELYKNKSNEIYAAINLDDGYMDNYLYAYPILKRYDMPATIFLTTDFIEKKHAFWWDRVFNLASRLDSNKTALGIDMKTFSKSKGVFQKNRMIDEINKLLRKKEEKDIDVILDGLEKKFSLRETEPAAMLGWDQIKEMNDNGISFGAHTKTHRNLCLLEDREVLEELVYSKKEIEGRLGVDVREFSYPFGAFNKRIRRITEKAGFRCARTSLTGINYKDTDRFLLVSVSAGSLLKISSFVTRVSFLPLIHGKRQIWD